MAIDRPNEPERPVGVDNPEMGWGSDVVAEVVRQLDIPYIAMVPGASYRGFQDSLVNYLGNRDPQMLVCLHEEHCVAIAHGYAKVTDKPMAAAVHSNVECDDGDLRYNRAPVMVFCRHGCRAPSMDRLDTHLARPGRLGARLCQMGRSAGVAGGGHRIGLARQSHHAPSAKGPGLYRA